jgi:hypothetical protein
MSIKIGTFNAENLFLRYKFLATVRGSMGKEKVDINKFIDEGGNINMLEDGFDTIDDPQTKNTAQVILKNDPDVICLQEVENLETLKKFNSKYLKRRYPYSMLIDSVLAMIRMPVLLYLGISTILLMQSALNHYWMK